MIFQSSLTKGRLIKRYKRFLADVELADGQVVTVHCANSGSMLGLKEPGYTVYLSPNTNPKAKLDWRWEVVDTGEALVGINTSHPNRIVEAAVEAGEIPELKGYQSLKREVKYGVNSRIDLLLSDPNECYVEIKNVTLKENGKALFPDSVTARGTKHLHELMDMVKEGHRAVMFYLVQRGDCSVFEPAEEIDQTYASALREAHSNGVEILCYQCHVAPDRIEIDKPLKVNV